jgi:hypothetical protein
MSLLLSVRPFVLHSKFSQLVEARRTTPDVVDDENGVGFLGLIGKPRQECLFRATGAFGIRMLSMQLPSEGGNQLFQFFFAVHLRSPPLQSTALVVTATSVFTT